MATIQDDRTEEQKHTHVWAVVGTDTFLSGWGEAKGGASYAAWATTEDKLRDVEVEIERRGDMKRVRRVYLPDYKPGRNCSHFHIYVR